MKSRKHGSFEHGDHITKIGIEAVWRWWFGTKEKPPKQPLPATCECGERFKMQLTATGRNWVLICPTHGAVKIRRVEN